MLWTAYIFCVVQGTSAGSLKLTVDVNVGLKRIDLDRGFPLWKIMHPWNDIGQSGASVQQHWSIITSYTHSGAYDKALS